MNVYKLPIVNQYIQSVLCVQVNSDKGPYSYPKRLITSLDMSYWGH